MKVTIKRTGGFAGLTNQKAVESHSLAVADAEELHALVERSGLRDRGEIIVPAPAGAADHYAYEVLVEDGTDRFRGSYTDAGRHEGLQAIYDFVKTRP